jgi:molybdopterin-guanine dinucleotide biosynthesis protein B
MGGRSGTGKAGQGGRVGWAPPILTFAGPSGAGKTRLLTRLIRALRRRGLTLCALKHSGHPHAFDRRGKDTERMRRAGALAVAIEGPAGVAYFGPATAGPRELARLLPPCDLVLAEGFKRGGLPTVEVHRRAVSRAFLCARGRGVVAVVTDEPPPRRLPTFDPDDVEGVADFAVAFAARRRASRR